MLTRHLRPGLLVVAILVLSACGSDPGFNEETDFVTKTGYVRLVNMMPDSPEIVMLHGLQRSQLSFPFMGAIEQRAVDRYDWEIGYLNSNEDEVTVAEQENQQISEDVLSTFLMMGTLQQPNILVVDSPVTLAADRPDGLADVWFASNLSNYPMVDLYLTELNADLTSATPIASVTSGSFTSRINVAAAAEAQLRVTVAGTLNVIFDSGAIEIPEKVEDLFALVDDFGPDGENHANVIRALASGSVIRDSSQTPSVRIGNYSEQPSIKASVGTTQYEGVAKATRSATRETTNGTVTYTVSSPTDELLEETDVTVARGVFQTIYAFENKEADATSVTRSLIVAESLRLVRDRSLFKFINGSDELVDLYVLRPGQGIDEVLPFLDNHGFAGTLVNESIATTIEFVVRNANNTETLASLNSRLLEGESYTLVYDTEGSLRLLTD